MRRSILVSVFSLVAIAVSASGAASAGDQRIVLCIRHDGSTYSTHCAHTDKGMLCDCGADYHVAAPVCAKSEQPAPTTTEANKARFDAAAAGKLDTATFEGHRFCVSMGAHRPMHSAFGGDLSSRDTGHPNMGSVQSSQGQH